MNFNQFHKLIWKGSFNLFFFQLTVVPQVMAIIVVRSKRKFQIQSLGFALLSQSISSPHAFPQSEWFTNFPQSEFWHVSLSHPEFHAQPLDFLMECFVLVQNRNQESGSNFSHKTNLGMPHYFTSNFLPSHSFFRPTLTSLLIKIEIQGGSHDHRSLSRCRWAIPCVVRQFGPGDPGCLEGRPSEGRGTWPESISQLPRKRYFWVFG